jgi:2-dehydro-3-deoxyphosphogluconate aldolase/(4S)-4-hydroxy-2-oxoglutarate aldolase
MVRYVPTGGITPGNAAEYLAVRSVVAVGGTWLTPQEVLAAGEWATITGLAADAAAIVRRVRSGNAPQPGEVRQPG